MHQGEFFMNILLAGCSISAGLLNLFYNSEYCTLQKIMYMVKFYSSCELLSKVYSFQNKPMILRPFESRVCIKSLSSVHESQIQ